MNKALGTGIVLLATGLASITHSSSANSSQLPAIDNNQSKLISPAEEERIGKLVAGNLNRLSASNSLAIRLWLTDLIRPLLNHSDLANKEIELFLVNDRSINAFAAPGGVMGVHTGLILKVKSVEELIAVMAHEIAHISQRHYAYRRADQENKSPLYMGAFLASMVLASSVNANIGEAAIHATNAAIVRDQMAYSRANEQEADRIGLQLMQASGFDSSKMLSMLSYLDSPFVDNDPNWEWARSHPISEQRLADVSSRIDKQSNNNERAAYYQQGFTLLQILLATQLTDTTKQSLQDIVADLDPLADDYLLYQQFAEAMGAMHQQQWQQASLTLARLSHSYPSQMLIWERWMWSLLQQAQYEQVIEQTKLRRNLGFNTLLSYLYQAAANEALGNVNEAIRLMSKLVSQQPRWIMGWQLLAEWHAKYGDLAAHRLAKSQWHLLRGEFDPAREQALLGQQLAGLSNSQQQQLQALLDSIKVLEQTAANL